MTSRRGARPAATGGLRPVAHDLDIWMQDDDFETPAELAPSLRARRG